MARFLKREAFVRVGASPKPKSSKPRLKTKSVRVQESPIPTKKSDAQPSGEVLSGFRSPLYPGVILRGWVTGVAQTSAPSLAHIMPVMGGLSEGRQCIFKGGVSRKLPTPSR